MEFPEKEIAKQVIEGNGTKKQAREVAEWLADTAEGQSYLAEMLNHDILKIEAGEYSDLSLSVFQSKQIYDEIMRCIYQKQRRRTWMRIVAVLLPLLLLGGLTLYTDSQVDLFGSSDYTEIFVPKGKQQHIIFQDGSEAFLNAETNLRFPTKFGLTDRKIYLQGEGYFNVKPAKNRPFIVQINNLDVTVRGTSFNVQAYKDDKNVTVVLDKGLIAFNLPIESYDLKPGQKAVYDKTTGKCIITALDKSSDESLWKEDAIRFKDTPLADVMRTLSRKYDVIFNVQNPQALTYSYTLVTYESSLKEIIGELEKITPVRFEIVNDSMVNIYLK